MSCDELISLCQLEVRSIMLSDNCSCGAVSEANI